MHKRSKVALVNRVDSQISPAPFRLWPPALSDRHLRGLVFSKFIRRCRYSRFLRRL